MATSGRSLGTLTIDLVANIGGFVEGLDKAERATDKLTRAEKRQYESLQRLVGSIDPVMGRLNQLADQQRKVQAAFDKGLIDKQVFDQLSARISKTTSELNNLGQRTGLTAKQMQLAVAGLPAQFSDIFVSLQGGQAPLTVFLQQGLQIRDMFGSATEAAKAFGKQLVALATNPYLLLIGAVAALGYAYVKGTQEGENYAKAIILTGNAAGATTGQLADMAKRLDSLSGVTRAKAAAALAEIAGSATFTASQIELVGRAALQMEVATGKAADETVKDFEKIAKDPAKALAELDRQYNFLNYTQLAQIRTLEEQGRTQEAVTMGFGLYAGMIEERAPQIEQRLTKIGEVWKFIKGIPGEIGSFVSGLMVEDSPLEKMKQQLEALQKLDANIDPRRRAENRARIEELKKQIATQEEADKKAANAAVELRRVKEAAAKAELDIAAASKAALSNEEKRVKAVKDYRENIEKIRAADPNSPLLDPKKIAKDIANINEQFKTTVKKAKEAKAYQDDAATTLLMSLREQGAALRSQIGLEERQTRSRRELVQFEQRIADLKTKKQLTADQKSILAAESLLRAEYERNALAEDQLQADKVQDDAATKMVLSIKQQTAALEEQLGTGKKLTAARKALAEFEAQIVELQNKDRLTKEQKQILAGQEEVRSALRYNVALEERIEKNQQLIRIEQYRMAMQDQVDARQESADQEVFGKELGDRERRYQEQQLALRRQFAKERTKLAKEQADSAKALTKEEYDAKLAIINESEAKIAGILQKQNQDVIDQQNDAGAGFRKVFNDLREEIDNFAGRSEEAMNTIVGAFGSAVSAGSDLAANSILWGDSTKEQAKAVARTLLTDTMSALIQLGAKQIWYYGIQRAQIAATAATANTAAASTAAAQVSANTAIAASAAPAAAGTSLATLGANVPIALAGLAAVYGLTKVLSSGGRAAGGAVTAGGMYEIGEANNPELLRIRGKTFLMPGNQGGYVQPAIGSMIPGMAGVDGLAAGAPQINVINNAPGVVVAQRGGDLTIEMIPELMEMFTGKVAADMADGNTAISRSLSGRLGPLGGSY